MGKKIITPAMENYLEAIYVIQKVKNTVRVIDISTHLRVTMASVTGIMRKLAAGNYIRYEKRKSVELTDEGEKIARIVNRRHEELYSFYHDILGAEKNLAQESACEVEHVLAPSIIERIIRLTQWIRELPDNMTEDFENVVRGVDSSVAVEPTTLDDMRPGEKAIVTKFVVAGNIGHRIRDMGLTKDVEIEMVRVAPLGDPIEIKVKGYHLSLRKSEASGIEVELIRNGK